MAKIMQRLCVVMVLFMISGCVTMPSQEEISKLDFGTPITIDYEKSIKNYFEKALFDPYSAKYEFEPPQQYWYKPSAFAGGPWFSRGPLYAGYLVIALVNAKNRFGAYIGMQKYGFLFKNNELIRVIEPQEFELASRS